MTTPSRLAREIDGRGRAIREVLAGRKYSIDYYQREDEWQQKQVADLIDDLSAKFLESHEEGNERSADEFVHPSEFVEYRNRVGGLLLLPKRFNASDGHLPFAEKRGHYLGQNLRTRSLRQRPYDHNPGFRAGYKKAHRDARQDLYRRLAERIWNPERLAQEAVS